MEEKLLTINLRKELDKTGRRRARNYMRILRNRIRRIVKTDKIRIDGRINEKVWSRSMGNPPLKLRIKTVKSDDGSVKVGLA